MGSAWQRVGIAVLVLGAGPLLSACLGGPPAPPPSLPVTYQLGGTCVQTAFDPSPGQPCVGGDANITIVNGSGGIEQRTVTFPYSVTITRPPDGFIYISGQLQGDGTVNCLVAYGVGVIQTANSNTEFGIATCSGSV